MESTSLFVKTILMGFEHDNADSTDQAGEKWHCFTGMADGSVHLKLPSFLSWNFYWFHSKYLANKSLELDLYSSYHCGTLVKNTLISSFTFLLLTYRNKIDLKYNLFYYCAKFTFSCILSLLFFYKNTMLYAYKDSFIYF